MSTLQAIPKLSPQELRLEIQKEYTSVACDPHKGYHFHTGRRLANLLGYDPALYASLPEANIASFAGTGNPFAVGPIHVGETVVDIGSGAGFDSLIAARMVGPAGHVVGIDMTPSMLAKARQGAAQSGMTHVEFREGYVESLPLPDNFAEVVISNGVLNLTLDKVETLREWFRVLKSGGRLQVGDIQVEKPLPAEALDDISLWTGWIAGALLEAELIGAVRTAGFEEVEIVHKYDSYEDVPDPSHAQEFGTRGITFRARKPARQK